MSALISFSGSFAVSAIAGKSGKVSKGSTNAANLVRGMTQAGIIGAALSSKGAIGKTAQMALSAHVVTLGALLALPSLDGGQWGNLLALLVGEFGVPTFNAATMRGKAGCAAYCTVTRAAFALAFDLADTEKAQSRALANIRSIDFVASDVGRLIEVANVERMSADAAADALTLAGMADADTVTIDADTVAA